MSDTLLAAPPASPDPATPPVAAPQPGAWSWAKEDGTLSEGWLDKLEGLSGEASLKSIGSIKDLAGSYVATKKLVGTKLEAPGENATPEQLATWRKTVGAPETPEGYLSGDVKSLRPETIPEGMWDVAGEKAFLAIAHKHSLPPAAVKEILGYYGESVAKGLQSSQEQEGAVLAAEGAKLKAAWGGDHDANLQMAARVATTIGLDPKTHPAFTDASVVQAFAKMGKLLSEDKLVRGDAGGISGSIKARASEITDPASQSTIAREYRGEFGPERQAAAQTQYHQLLAASAS